MDKFNFKDLKAAVAAEFKRLGHDPKLKAYKNQLLIGTAVEVAVTHEDLLQVNHVSVKRHATICCVGKHEADKIVDQVLRFYDMWKMFSLEMLLNLNDKRRLFIADGMAPTAKALIEMRKRTFIKDLKLAEQRMREDVEMINEQFETKYSVDFWLGQFQGRKSNGN